MIATPSTNALPWVLLNGRFVRAEKAAVSVFDRSFQLGDGLFETLRVINGCPIQWREHWRRFAATAKWLNIPLPCSGPAGLIFVHELLKQNHVQDAILRLHLSRGPGPRGYSPRGAGNPTLLMALYPAPVVEPGRPRTVRLGLSSFRLDSHNPTQQHKTTSRVLHVLAKAEADDAGYDDALLLDARGRVLEATSSNFFWFRGQTLVTPPLSAGILPGTTRAHVIKLAKRKGIAMEEQLASIAQIVRGKGAFLTVSTSGIIAVTKIGNHRVAASPMMRELHAELEQRWQLEAVRKTR